MQGRRQKIFQRGERKKDRKLAKNNEKTHYLAFSRGKGAFIYYICTIYENPGGEERARPPLPMPMNT